MAEKSIVGAPELLRDLKQPLLPEIGRELCRVRDSDVKGKQGSGNVHVIRTYSRNMGGGLRATGYTLDRGEFRGYRRDILTENLSEIESILLLCNRCKGIMREACISTTREQFCECCRNSKQSYNLYYRNEQTIPNTHVRKTVLSLKCSCPLKERGCEWLGTLGKCENHLDACSHVHEKCKIGCGIVLQREELKIHMYDKCEYRKVPCGFCKNDFKAYGMFQHQAKCPNFPLKCEKGCGTTVDREKMAQHLEKDCDRVLEKCKFGCGKVLERKELKIHMNDKCEYRKVPCGFCEKDFEVRKMLIHQAKCPKVRLKCEKGCGTTVDRKDMAQHLEKDCGRVIEKCKLGCGIELPRDELEMHVNDECVQRMIPCKHCKRDFKVCDLSNHLEVCPKMLLKCELKCGTVVCRKEMAQHLKKDCRRVIEHCKLGCGIELPRDELEMHVKTKCEQRMVTCEYCYIDFKACDMSNHNKKCQKMPLSCELRCGTIVCREDMVRHIEEECVEKKVECPFIKYKCEVGLIKRKELNQHLKEKRTEHTELKLSAMEEIVMQQSGQLKTLFSITNTTKLEWRIENVGKYLRYSTYSTSQQFQVDRFNFTLRLIYDSIGIYYPRQESSKVKVKFIFRIISPSNPDVIWESKSNIIEIKQTGGSYDYRIDTISQIKEFLRDDGIDLEILVTLL